MKVTPSFLTSALASADLNRLGNELYDLQRQTASGAKADDLKGYGDDAGRLVSVRTAIAQNTARVNAATQLQTRFDIQDTAFTKVTTAVADLKKSIFTAISADDGTYLATQIQSAFELINSGLNTTYDGAPLFSGERRDVATVSATSLDDITAKLASGSLFNESANDQTVDVGLGSKVTVAPRASTFASGVYAVLSDLNTLTRNNGLSTPLTTSQRNQLTDLATRLGAAETSVLTAQGKSGNAQSQLEKGIARLSTHNDLLTKHLGDIADANLAEVSMKLSAVQTQYKAAASVFSQIKDLSLVNFLK